MLIVVWPPDANTSDHTSLKRAKRRCFLCLCLSPRGKRSNGFGKWIKLCFEWCRLGTFSVFPGASLAEPDSLQAFVPHLGFCQTPLLWQSCSDRQTAWLAAFSSEFCCFSSHAKSDLLCCLHKHRRSCHLRGRCCSASSSCTCESACSGSINAGLSSPK